MDKPRVLVTIPYYQQVVGDVIDSHYRIGDPEVFIPGHFGDAFLARNFNACLAAALNNQKRLGLTHLLMVHADVEPLVDRWGEILLSEQQRTGADLLSVVLPIKTPHGQTSTAVEDPEGRIRMLTMTEVFNIPYASFDGPLAGFLNCRILCSTGLWVLKLGDWAREVDERGRLKIWFEVRDRIIKNPNYNHDWATRGDEGEPEEFVRETIPEDWHFSRLLHERGLKVMSTKRIPCAHHGGMSYTNTGAWGSVKESVWHGPYRWVSE